MKCAKAVSKGAAFFGMSTFVYVWRNFSDMRPLPVIHSIISPAFIQQLAVRQYGFGSAVECRLLRAGINHSYLLSEGTRRHVFRVYSFGWRERHEIEEEIKLLNLLKAGGVAVSYPVQTTNGDYIQELHAPEGIRHGVMFSFARGVKKRHFSLDNCRSAGKMMADMHRLSAGIHLQRVNYNAEALVRAPHLFARRHFAESSAEMRLFKKAGDLFVRVLAATDQAQLRHGAIHLDFWYDNMSVEEDETMTLFDFDFCGNGLFIYDVAYFLMQLYHIELAGGDYEGKKGAFLEGYSSKMDITAAEKRLLPYAGLAVWLFYFGVQCQRFDNWSNIFLSENYFKRYMSMVSDWLGYHGISVD